MMMFIPLVAMLFLAPLTAEPLIFDIQGDAGILINADSLKILFEKNAHIPLYPASTTKIATAIYALHIAQEGDWEREVAATSDCIVSITPEKKKKANYTLPAHWLETDASHMGIKKGEVFTLRTLFEGMMIVSGDDAANIIAHELGPTIPAFMEGMNGYLKEIGCKNTYFCNPHGLHDPRHVSTAYDLALMAKEGLKYPLFAETVAKSRFLRPKTNMQAATAMLGTNRLLRTGKHHYSKAIGIKTGYHSKAKKTFVGAARLKDRTLIVALLGYSEPGAIFVDAAKLFEAAFNQPKVKRVLMPAGPQPYTRAIEGAKEPIRTYLKEPLELEYYPAEEPQVKCVLTWETLTPPVRRDAQVGEIKLIAEDGAVMKRVVLHSERGVGLTWQQRWKRGFYNMPWKAIAVVECFAVAGLVVLFRKHAFRR